MNKELEKLTDEEFLNIIKFHSEQVKFILKMNYMSILLFILLKDLNIMLYLMITLKEQ